MDYPVSSIRSPVSTMYIGKSLATSLFKSKFQINQNFKLQNLKKKPKSEKVNETVLFLINEIGLSR